MLYWETSAVCSEIRTKHVNKAVLYYRRRSYHAEKNSSLYLYGGPWNSNIGALQALRFTNICLLFCTLVINHLQSEIKLKYLKTQSVPHSKHTSSGLYKPIS
jgi:hypothetical protein